MRKETKAQFAKERNMKKISKIRAIENEGAKTLGLDMQQAVGAPVYNIVRSNHMLSSQSLSRSRYIKTGLKLKTCVTSQHFNLNKYSNRAYIFIKIIIFGKRPSSFI